MHTAGFDDGNGVWRLVDVWETRPQAEGSMNQMMEAAKPADPPQTG